MCTTGPVLGIVLGGLLVEKFAGGYEGKHASTISLAYALCALCCSLPITVIENIYSFGVCLWCVLFFGGAVVPIVQGIMISSLKTDLRAAANSISILMQCLLGYIPAPLVYGLIYNYSKEFNKKFAMSCSLFYSSVGALLYGLSLYYRFKRFDKEGNLICESTPDPTISSSIDNKENFSKLASNTPTSNKPVNIIKDSSKIEVIFLT